MHTRQAKWLVAFIIFACLLFLIELRGMGAAVMLLVASGYFVTLSKVEMIRVVQATPVLIYPLLALFSCIWSEAPAITLRLSLQFLLTAGIGVLLYRTIPFRIFVSALFAASLWACAAGLSMSLQGVLVGLPMAGVAESKNMMAFFTGLLALSATAIFTDRGSSHLLRLASIGGGLFGVLCLFLAQSAGALVGTFLGMGVIFAARFFQSAAAVVRLTIVVAVLLLLPVGILAQSLLASEATEFSEDVLGKDATLTGRTYLWSRAGEYIAEKPLVGHGYGAFWRQGSVEPEGLWQMYGITTRSGFNFHNQFIEALMDVGYVGLVVFVGMLLLTMATLATRLLRGGSPELPFYAGMFVALAVRTPVESVMLTQFNIIAILLFMCSCAAIYGHEATPVRLALGARRRRLRRQKQDKGLVQRRTVLKRRREKRVVQVRAPRAVVRQRKRRGKRVLRQTKAGAFRAAPTGQTTIVEETREAAASAPAPVDAIRAPTEDALTP